MQQSYWVQVASDFIELMTEFLGFAPRYIVAVYVTVSLLSFAFRLREKYPHWAKFWLGLFCLVAGIGLMLASHGLTWIAFQKGLTLGSVAALSYQLIKGFYRGLVVWMERRFDIDVNGSVAGWNGSDNSGGDLDGDSG